MARMEKVARQGGGAYVRLHKEAQLREIAKDYSKERKQDHEAMPQFGDEGSATVRQALTPTSPPGASPPAQQHISQNLISLPPTSQAFNRARNVVLNQTSHQPSTSATLSSGSSFIHQKQGRPSRDESPAAELQSPRTEQDIVGVNRRTSPAERLIYVPPSSALTMPRRRLSTDTNLPLLRTHTDRELPSPRANTDTDLPLLNHASTTSFAGQSPTRVHTQPLPPMTDIMADSRPPATPRQGRSRSRFLSTESNGALENRGNLVMGGRGMAILGGATGASLG